MDHRGNAPGLPSADLCFSRLFGAKVEREFNEFIFRYHRATDPFSVQLLRRSSRTTCTARLNLS
jgi:hypothetical protein